MSHSKLIEKHIIIVENYPDHVSLHAVYNQKINYVFLITAVIERKTLTIDAEL